MSRIGRLPIEVPAGVTVTIGEDNVITVKGPLGELTKSFPAAIKVEQEANVIHVTRPNDAKENRAAHGMTRSILNSMVIGVTKSSRSTASATVSPSRASSWTSASASLTTCLWMRFPASRWRPPIPTRSWSRAATSSRSARWLPASAASARLSLIRARASSTPTKSSAARKARPAPRRSKEVCLND